MSLREAIDAVPVPLSIFDANDRLLVCSGAYRHQVASAYGDLPDDLLAEPVHFRDIVAARMAAEHDPAQAARRTAVELRRHRDTRRKKVDINLDGSWTRRTHSVAPRGQVVNLDTPIDELIQNSRALAEAKRALEHQALHDPLTDLPNRRGLAAHLEELAKRSDASENVAVLHVDLDKFKLVNDTLGHDAGDKVLDRAAQILRGEIRCTDLVARVGGDEFVIICRDVDDEATAANFAQRIVELMAVPIPYNGDWCQIGASIGIALTESRRIGHSTLIDADIALYEAKKRGRGRYEFFSPIYRDRSAALQKRINEVRTGLDLNAFEPYFQPQVCARTGALRGFEALARWCDPENGVRGPGEFLPALIEARLIDRLDDTMMRQSIAALADWDEMGTVVPAVTLNLSDLRLAGDGFVDKISWAVEEAGLTPERIGLEILENVVVDTGNVVDILTRLSAVGFPLSLDDFGTGNASIGGLRTLSLQRIKIDRSFVSGIDTDPELQVITGAMITLARNLKLEALCEGVETEDEADTLRWLGADSFQGYLFGRPMERTSVPGWIEWYTDDQADKARQRASA